jgi:hypothetical protein
MKKFFDSVKKFFAEIKARWDSDMPIFWRKLFVFYRAVAVIAGYVAASNNPDVARLLNIPESELQSFNIFKYLLPHLFTPHVITLCGFIAATSALLALHSKLTTTQKAISEETNIPPVPPTIPEQTVKPISNPPTA